MGIGVSFILIAAGAILRWGVTANAEGVNLDTIGLILLVVGVVGLVLSMLFWTTWGSYGVSRRREVVDAGPTRDERVIYDDRV